MTTKTNKMTTKTYVSFNGRYSMLEIACEAWFTETARRDWNDWSPEAAQIELSNIPEEAEFPKCTAEELYNTMAQIIGDYDAINANIDCLTFD